MHFCYIVHALSMLRDSILKWQKELNLMLYTNPFDSMSMHEMYVWIWVYALWYMFDLGKSVVPDKGTVYQHLTLGIVCFFFVCFFFDIFPDFVFMYLEIIIIFVETFMLEDTAKCTRPIHEKKIIHWMTPRMIWNTTKSKAYWCPKVLNKFQSASLYDQPFKSYGPMFQHKFLNKPN